MALARFCGLLIQSFSILNIAIFITMKNKNSLHLLRRFKKAIQNIGMLSTLLVLIKIILAMRFGLKNLV